MSMSNEKDERQQPNARSPADLFGIGGLALIVCSADKVVIEPGEPILSRFRSILDVKESEQPTKEEQETFTFFWQHLRRNALYRELYEVTVTNRPPLVIEPEVLEEALKSKRKSRVEIQFLTEDAMATAAGLPVFLNPNISESEDAWRKVLKIAPMYFQSALWQQVQRRILLPMAIWNPAGDWGAGQSGYVSCEIGKELRGRIFMLNHLEKLLRTENSIARGAKQNDISVEQQRADWQKQCEQARIDIRRFLKEYRLMDFVLDTSVPWTTLTGNKRRPGPLMKQWKMVKDLRERVGLDRDEDPPRVHEKWHNQIKIWDLAKELERRDGHFPSWPKLAQAADPEGTETVPIPSGGKAHNVSSQVKITPQEALSLLAAGLSHSVQTDRTGLKDEAFKVQRAYKTAEAHIKEVFVGAENLSQIAEAALKQAFPSVAK